ncbi:hypothetical protein H0H92_012504, partial [Tricholoma furcatifolium]
MLCQWNALDAAVTPKHKPGIVQSERPISNRHVLAVLNVESDPDYPQLEQTVTKLQTSLGLSHEEIAVLPPPLARIRELEQENARLVKENDDYRRTLAELGRSQEGIRRNGLSSYLDVPRNTYDRHGVDYKRKKYHDDPEGEYMSPSDTPPQHQEPSRPPPLTIPQPLAQYQYSSANHQTLSSSSSLFNLNATPAFQMPNTPSSSATSSPPFS